MLVHIETKFSLGDNLSMLSLGNRIPCTVTDIAIRIDKDGYEVFYELKTVRKYNQPNQNGTDYYTYGPIEEDDLISYQE